MYRYQLHKQDCKCCICKNVRGELRVHSADCQCYVCQTSRVNFVYHNYKENCGCCICRSKRGEYKGERNYMKLEENKLKIRGEKHGMWQKPHSKETLRRMFSRRTMSEFETRMQLLINKYRLPYKFVGNGGFWIDGASRRGGALNPDFLHNEKKLVLEVYGSYQKLRGFGSCEIYERLRTERLHSCGYEVIFFNEKDLFREDFESHCFAKLNVFEEVLV